MQEPTQTDGEFVLYREQVLIDEVHESWTLSGLIETLGYFRKAGAPDDAKITLKPEATGSWINVECRWADGEINFTNGAVKAA